MDMLFTFEGIECSGKGEQIRRTISYFESLGIQYFLSQEPGGSPHGLMDRMLLKNPSRSARGLNAAFQGMKDYPQIPLDPKGNIEPALPETEILRFLDSRVNNTHRHIIPALEQGLVVLSDRHFHSTMAYQGYGKCDGDKRILDIIRTLHDLLIFPRAPITRTFYLDISYEVQERRKALAAGRDPEDVLENQAPEAFQRTLKGYRTMAR